MNSWKQLLEDSTINIAYFYYTIVGMLLKVKRQKRMHVRFEAASVDYTKLFGLLIRCVGLKICHTQAKYYYTDYDADH